MNKNFYIGQLVEAIVDYPTNNEYIHKGDIGRIVWLNNCANVEWDKNVHGHSCGHKAKEGHGWNVNFYEIAPLDEINISLDGFDELI